MRGIRVETARMQTLIDDLLLLARLDEGRPLASERMDLVAVLEDAVDAARAVGPDWPITLDAAAPVEVIGDPMALRQVIDNLLANVRTHTPRGDAATVRLRVDPAATPGYVVLEVADEGPGLDAEHLERVFERFYRVDTSRSRDRGGSGLGLAVVAALVAAHHGRVEVVERAGRRRDVPGAPRARARPAAAGSGRAAPPRRSSPSVAATRSSGP